MKTIKKYCPIKRGYCISAECELFNYKQSECCFKTIGFELALNNSLTKKFLLSLTTIINMKEYEHQLGAT